MPSPSSEFTLELPTLISQRRYVGQYRTVNDLLYSEFGNTMRVGDTVYVTEEDSYYVYDGNGFSALANNITRDDNIEDAFETMASFRETIEANGYNRLIDESYATSQSFIRFDENTHSFVYTPSDTQIQFPYVPTQEELDDYEVYLRRKNPSCRNEFPIAIGKLAERFLVMINEGIAELSIE